MANPNPSNVVHQGNDVNWERALTAIVAYPTLDEASEFLAEKGITCSPKKLAEIRRRNQNALSEIQKTAAPMLEQQFADDALGIARMATAAEAIAIERVTMKLRNGEIRDEATAARNLADVKAKNMDKRFMVEGRPTSVSDQRSPDEILAKLVAMKVLKPVDAEATAVED